MTCSVASDGGVYPCAFLQDERFLSGNVFTDGLGSIWHLSPVFKALRDIALTSCGVCPRFHLCHGGCPAVAYFLTHSLQYHDPECLVSLQREPDRSSSVYSPHGAEPTFSEVKDASFV